MKLCVLGFDGFDSELFANSTLPNIKWLRENSQWGTLWSDEMRTGPCWSTILNGWNIETHGITHLLGYPKDGSEWFLSRPRDYIFDVLHDNGYSVGVANFPSLLMPRNIGNVPGKQSWMIAGWPRRPQTNATIKLPERLCSDLPDYEERFLADDWRKPKGALPDWAIHELPWNEYIDWVAMNAYTRLDVQFPSTDVLMIQESVLDRSGHMLSTPNKGRLGTEDPRYQDALKLVDALIEVARKDFQPDYLSIVSDHGFQGISEADPEKGCWHSHRGIWAIAGNGIENVRNDIDQIHYTPTILGALGIDVERDGKPMLIDFSDVDRRLAGLGYT